MNIDWSQLITRDMKEAAAAVARLNEAQALLTRRNEAAATQISRIQDRVETLGYGIDAGAATPQDEAEQRTLVEGLKAWKTYKFNLGNVPRQAGWPVSPDWPAPPAIPEISAVPEQAVGSPA
ncbi:phage tail protein [Pseudomonas kribbensis]|uniref:phage tail protein n=1 Tax=Pseudomonas kribbensis TaxID=1628086 RepID=UPI003D78A546